MASEVAVRAARVLLRHLGGAGSGNFGHAGRPGEVGGSGSGLGVPNNGHVTQQGLDQRFPLAGEKVDGLTIPDFHDEFGPDVPNTSSISASLGNDYEVLDGIREVRMSDFEDNGKPSFYSSTEESRVKQLAERIQRSRTITPLIVVVDEKKSPYVLEGGHRFDALKLNGVKKFPALVVVDTSSLRINAAQPSLLDISDALEPKFSVAIRAAMSVARKQLPDQAKAAAALGVALMRVLPPLYVQAVTAGGQAVTLKTAGGEGSGNFGHAGRPGEVGGSAHEKAVAQVTVKGLTKEHIGAILALKKEGKTQAQIQASIQAQHGLTEKQVANTLYNYNVKLKAVKAAVEGVKEPPPPKEKTPSEKATEQGYVFQAKTSGPNAGKYAWFQNGAQVSGFGAMDQKDALVGTLHYGTGLPQPVVPVSTTLSKGWPIADSVPRVIGTHYPTMMDAQGHAWADKLTHEEKSAIEQYTGSEYPNINGYLRTGYDVTDGYASKLAQRISSAIAKAPSPPPPELVWRSVGHSLSDMKKGDVITMAGLQSTTIKPAFAVSWKENLLEIKPSRGAYVAPISEHSHEKEYLLPHNAKYRVRGVATVTLQGIQKKVLQLEML